MDGQQSSPAEVGTAVVLGFREIRVGMLPLVGGKAANLGELTAGGLPVPPGFCLSTAAYRRAVDSPELAAITEQLSTADPQDIESLSALAAAARRTVLNAGMPDDIAAAVSAAYAGLGNDVPVAVRSSATAEDLPFASFAGQQDTYLNVIGTDALLAAVRRCWASLFTDRAVTYRAANGIDSSAVALAVVVQSMVDATAAGVMFTANPVTGRRNEAVIDASPGLGEAVVSGAVNPDHFVVDGVLGAVRERRLGDKKVVIRPKAGGGTERFEADPIHDDGRASLDDRAVLALAALGRRVEAHYGAPQDIEWAIDRSGKLWLTQARPITTLYPLPRRAAPARGDRLYLCFSLAQGLTRPITPMGMAAIRLIGSSVARAARFDIPHPRKGPPPFAEAGQRIYFDLTTALRSSIGRKIVPRVFDIMEARSAVLMRRFFDDPRFAVEHKGPWRLLRHVLPIAATYRVPETLLRSVFRPASSLERVDEFSRNLEAALEVPENLSARDRLAHVERILSRELFSILPNTLPPAIVGFGALALVHKVMGKAAPFRELQAVLRGLPHNVTTEMDLELWSLARSLRSDPETRTAFGQRGPEELAADYRAGTLPSAAQSGLEGFLGIYGHRAIAEIDLGMPRWSEDPTHIIGVLANYLRLKDDALSPDEQFRTAAREAEEYCRGLVARASRGPLGLLRGRLVRAALDRTRTFAGLRELPKYTIVKGLAAARHQIALIGSELMATGAIDKDGDVFFLDLDEARRGLDGTDLRRLVARRKEDYGAELGRRHIPRMLMSDGTEPEALQAPAGQGAGGEGHPPGALLGTPASAGMVTAAARVITDPVGARLEPGEILVAPSTDPGWTPLFLTAGGLVMEMGGANSHGAVVAREYGIPAVVGVPDATTLISTGQQVSVDGASGTVTPA